MFSELLPHTLEVYARSGKVDRFGTPVDQNPGQTTGTPRATYRCRAYLRSGGLTAQERNLDVYERVWEIFVAPEADIAEDDALKVIHSDGTVLLHKAKVLDRETVYDATGPHHLEIMVAEQSGPNPART